MDESQFYAATAQVIATLLVVVAIEMRRMAPLDAGPRWLWRTILHVTLWSAVFGVGLALGAVRASEPVPSWYRLAVTLAVTSQLALVGLMGWRAISQVMRDSDERPAPATRPGVRQAERTKPPNAVSMFVLWLVLRRRRPGGRRRRQQAR